VIKVIFASVEIGSNGVLRLTYLFRSVSVPISESDAWLEKIIQFPHNIHTSFLRWLKPSLIVKDRINDG
jgi:hypothetical protein